MNLFKEIAKIFVHKEVAKERAKTEAKLKEKLKTSTGSEAVEYATYLKLIEEADSKVIEVIDRLIDKM